MKTDYSALLAPILSTLAPADLAAAARVAAALAADPRAKWNLTVKGLSDLLAGEARLAARVAALAAAEAAKGKGGK